MTQINKYRYFVCLTERNEIIGIDRASGGYPWIPQSLSAVAFWTLRAEAERYCAAFKNHGNFKNMRVKEFKFELGD